jgi:hypothetical protein
MCRTRYLALLHCCNETKITSEEEGKEEGEEDAAVVVEEAGEVDAVVE